MQTKLTKVFFILLGIALSKFAYNKYELSKNSHFVVTPGTIIKPGSKISKYVTQEEVDSFGFRYWDIDNNYTKRLEPIVVPLREALKQKDTNKVINYIKDNNLSVDVIIEDGTTPLMYSSFYNDLNTSKELIKLGADVHKKDEYKLGPMAYAIENNATKTVKLLLDNGVKFDEVGMVQGYLHSPNYGNIKSLIINGDDIQIEYGSYWDVYRGSKLSQPLFTYVANRNLIEIAKLMLESGYRPKAYFSCNTDKCEENDNFDDLTLGVDRNGGYENTIYSVLDPIPNHEPMLDLLLEHNIPGQPSKNIFKKEYDECYTDYQRLVRSYVYFLYNQLKGIDEEKESEI